MAKKKKHKRQNRVALVIALLLVAFFVYLFVSNTSVGVTEYTVRSPYVKNPFCIVQLSDMHLKTFGKEDEKLLNRIIEAEPDLVVITGDTFDRRAKEGDDEHVKELLTRVANLCPVYIVSGNHEAAVQNLYDNFCKDLASDAIRFLDNDVLTVTVEENEISVIGLRDPAFTVSHSGESADTKALKDGINELTFNKNTFTLLLSHRPVGFDVYEENDISLALCGHLHGGMLRLPYVGGVFGGYDKLFPEYDSGLFVSTNGDTTMVVSRGLAGVGIIPRVFNTPEVVVVHVEPQ